MKVWVSQPTPNYFSQGLPQFLTTAQVYGAFRSLDIWTLSKNKAIRLILGTHRFAPNYAINGDVGWVSSTVRRRTEMLRFWNRVIDIDTNRLTKQVFLWDFHKRGSKGNWNSDIYKLFVKIGKLYVYWYWYNNQTKVDICEAKNALIEEEKSEWYDKIQLISKLSNYRKFKNEYSPESLPCSSFNVCSVALWYFAT